MHLTQTIIVLLVTTSFSHAQDLTDLPSSHPVYDLLDRLEARGFYGTSLPEIRPYSRERIYTSLVRAARSTTLSATERARVKDYTADFSDHKDRSVSGRLPRNIYTHRDSVLTIQISPLLRQTAHVVSDDQAAEQFVSQTYVGIALHGTLHDHIAFRLQHFEAREWSDLPRTSRFAIWASPVETVQLKGKTADFRETRYQLRLSLPWFVLDFGKEAFDWGPGRDANLALHNHSPSYLYARLQAHHKALRFEHVFGALRTPVDAIDLATTTNSNGHRRALPPPKRFVAHRLELALTRNLRLGLHESVVYGDRGFEPAYAIPVSVLVGAQSYAGETDNLAFGADLVCMVSDKAKLYGAVFFDDLSKFSPGAFSNQVGIQIGAHWVNPFGLSDLDIRSEYARLEPYTYAHNFDINAYTHFDSVLGHPLGPNADRISLNVRWWASRHVRIGSSLSRSREGENYTIDNVLANVGGDARQGRRPTDAAERIFLAGDRTTTTELSLQTLIEAGALWRFSLRLQRKWTDQRPIIDAPRPDRTTSILSLSTELSAF